MKERSLVIGMVMVLLAALAMLAFSDFSGTNRITGLLTSPEGIDMQDTEMVYSVAPLTKLKLDYGFEEYEEMASYARELIWRCRGLADEISTYDCINYDLKHGWLLEGNVGSYYMFAVASQYYTWEYDTVNQKIMKRGILYRFALDFS